jgi:surface carbohydrate biosynthesis protein
MYKRIIFFIKIFIHSRIKFKNPPSNKLMIFDNSDIFSLKESLLKDYEYYVFEDRGHLITKIYLSLDILKNIYVNKKYGIKLAYKIAIIKLVNPRLILTFIHNSENFSNLSKILSKKYNFLAIQNSSFYYRIREAKYLKKKENIKIKNFSIPHLLSFSKFDNENYLSLRQIKVNKYDTVGSLRLENFKNRLKKNIFIPKMNKYDICLLSEVGAWELKEKSLDLKFAKLFKYIIRYSKEKKIRLVIALKRQKIIANQAKLAKNIIRGYRIEQDWFKKFFNKEEYNFLKKRFKFNYPYSSYEASAESKVTIAAMSTMLRENFSQKKKILACNFTSNKVYDFPIKGICSINHDCNYDYFKKRLDKILKISKKNYFKEADFKKDHDLICNKKNETIKKISKIMKIYLK